MPLRPPTPCSFLGCPTLVYGGGGRCGDHIVHAKRASAKFRRERLGQREGDIYGPSHRWRFRRGVLRRDPYCRCELTDHAWHPVGPCPSASSEADHWPLDKRALIALGLDSDDPAYGRGLCHRCHSSSTARLQPGGWHKPAH